MTREHRRIHRVLWPTMALLVALGFTLALVLRPPPEAPAPEAPTIEQGK
jgi:hypothetical protein